MLPALKHEFQAFHVALAFLTRWGRPHLVDDVLLAKSLRYYGIVGFLVGLFPVTCLWLLQTLGYSAPWVLALVYVLLEVWLTRGLHYDAIADLGDALGSGAQGEKFWHILYDSRLGAMGAMALFFTLSAGILAAHNHILQGSFLPLLLAPAFGRLTAVAYACITPARTPHSLGGKVCAGKSPALLGASLVAISGLCIPLDFTSFLSILILNGIALFFLHRHAHIHGGCNGDFLGSAIIISQTLFLLFA